MHFKIRITFNVLAIFLDKWGQKYFIKGEKYNLPGFYPLLGWELWGTVHWTCHWCHTCQFLHHTCLYSWDYLYMCWCTYFRTLTRVLQLLVNLFPLYHHHYCCDNFQCQQHQYCCCCLVHKSKITTYLMIHNGAYEAAGCCLMFWTIQGEKTNCSN